MARRGSTSALALESSQEERRRVIVNRILSIVAPLACASVAAAEVRNTLDPTMKHQTIAG
jgi:hypothetical protein